MRIATTITAMVSIMLLMTSLSSLYVPSFSGEIAQGQVGQQQAGNVPPIANTSPDRRVSEGDLVTLNGSGSFDPDGKIVSYTWGIEDSDDEAPPVSLNGQNTSIATFTAPMVAGNVNANSYLFELTVTDDNGLKGTNTSKVVVEKGATTR
jgi:K319L-like, PKD domain